MFYLVRNLKTSLLFSPHDMDKLNNQKAVIQQLKQKMQGLCFNKFGYIVKIIRDKNAYSQEIPDQPMMKQQEQDQQKRLMANSKIRQFIISTPEVEEIGIKVYVTFSAMCFKAQQYDLIQFKVSLVEQQSVIGSIGPVQVVAPKTKIEGFEYKKDQNILFTRTGSEGKLIKIDKGTKIKARCISSNIQMNDKMKIIVEIPKSLIMYIEN